MIVNQCDISDVAKDNFSVLGMVLTILSTLNNNKPINTSYINSVIWPAIHHRQIIVFLDRDTVPYAFAIWCKLSEDTTIRYINNPDFELHISEWNEGENFWIHDFYSRPSKLLSTVRFLKNKFLKNADDNIGFIKNGMAVRFLNEG
ncbi:toxin-activating lysine-acyltransferase [Aeromonas hydrophila]|uniref:toxin-activating lysine-acyltransferase n=1 Tax=Aeromonas hydrophila TaxID=644 RepID=UPI0021E68130|nr:toxin-activating lysine-acyltransferase [Aeromonas hydrophila]MCV3275096.1 toxin-activating lysine-acyltransferase [Aeromonas hydrophila]